MLVAAAVDPSASATAAARGGGSSRLLLVAEAVDPSAVSDPGGTSESHERGGYLESHERAGYLESHEQLDISRVTSSWISRESRAAGYLETPPGVTPGSRNKAAPASAGRVSRARCLAGAPRMQPSLTMSVFTEGRNMKILARQCTLGLMLA